MSGASLDSALGGLVGALLLVILFVVLRRSPKVALVSWLITIFFVPVWIGQQVSAYFPAFVIVGTLAALSLLPTPLEIRPSLLDVVFLALGLTAVGLFLLGMTTRSATFDLLTIWVVAFVLGRIIVQVVEPEWIYGAFALFGGAAGALAVLEFLTGRNLFISFLANNTATFGVWGSLQPRGSVLRAEGAFGHAIALGITLGVAACFALGSRLRPALKTLLVVLAGAGALVSFSRAGILTVLLAVLLTCAFLRGHLTRRYRLGVLLLMLAAAAVALEPILSVFASSDEAEGSALYRTQLLGLVQSMRPFGITGDFSVTTSNQASVGGFGSVDNALLLVGLIFGWVPLAFILAAALGAVVLVLRRGATTATIAVVAQLPGLLTVAFITQYGAVAWFTAGMAVGTQQLARWSTSRPAPSADPASAFVTPESAHA